MKKNGYLQPVVHDSFQQHGIRTTEKEKVEDYCKQF